MPLVAMEPLLRQADRDNRAVGAFSVGSMEMILGAVRAAEQTNTPIILQIAQVRLPYAPLALIGPMMLSAAKEAAVPVAVHFDHGKTLPAIRQALEIGFTSVMFDGSGLPYEENLAQTRAVVELARQTGATVEAELGIIGGSEDGSEDLRTHCTDPSEAQAFAAQAGINALAVAIGNAHGNYVQTPKLNFDVLAEIHSRVALPLVLHGGTGISDSDFRRLIDRGVRKINIATANFDGLTHRAEQYLQSPGRHNYFDLNTAMTQGVADTVQRHIHVFNNGKDLTR